MAKRRRDGASGLIGAGLIAASAYKSYSDKAEKEAVDGVKAMPYQQTTREDAAAMDPVESTPAPPTDNSTLMNDAPAPDVVDETEYLANGGLIGHNGGGTSYSGCYGKKKR